MERIEFEFHGRGRRSKYSNIDWDKCFDGGTYKFQRGKDFRSKPSDFQQAIYYKARLRNSSVKTSVVGDFVMMKSLGQSNAC